MLKTNLKTKKKRIFHLIDSSQLPFWISFSVMWFLYSVVCYWHKFFVKNCKNPSINIFSVSFISKKNNQEDSILDLILRFLHIWSAEQWISSIVVMIFLYIFAAWLYNRFAAHRLKFYLHWKMVLSLIVFDMGLNFIIGVYYMNYRETAFGQFMVKCPIAISPFIFFIELIVVILLFKISLQNKTSNKK